MSIANQLMNVDKLTFGILVGFWPIWIAWELALLIWRGHNPSVDLISMVARDRAYQMTSLAFAWGSLAAHFWVNWRDLYWHHSLSHAVSGVVFFLLIAIVLVWDVYLWKNSYDFLPFWMRVVRFPGIMLFLGLLNGALIFPQKGRPSMPF